MNNEKIREKAKKEGVKLWQIANALGIADTTFSRWLREELPQETKVEIFKIIQALKEAKENDN